MTKSERYKVALLNSLFINQLYFDKTILFIINYQLIQLQ